MVSSPSHSNGEGASSGPGSLGGWWRLAWDPPGRSPRTCFAAPFSPNFFAYNSRIQTCTGAFHCWLGEGMFLSSVRGLSPNSFAMRMVSALRRHFFAASAHSGSWEGDFFPGF